MNSCGVSGAKNTAYYLMEFDIRWQVGFVVDNVALGQVFSEYFGFPCQSLFHQILHHHNHQVGTIGQ
jgi:hypothetical protein